MKENPERMFGRPEKIDTTPRQSYTDKRDTYMAETGEGPKPPEEASKSKGPPKPPKEGIKNAGKKEDKAKDTVKKESPKPPLNFRRGKAVWHSKSGDYDVTITGYWGKGSDKRDYAKYEYVDEKGKHIGGIPFEEISFPAEEKSKVEKERAEYKKSLKEAAQKKWDSWKEQAKAKGGYPGTPEYKKGIQALINAGKMPLGSEDPKVQQIADAFNREMALHARGKIKPEYITSLIDSALKYKHDPGVNTEAADNLIAELQAKRREAERRPPVKKSSLGPKPDTSTKLSAEEIEKLRKDWEPFYKKAKSEAEKKAIENAINMGTTPGEVYGRGERGWFYLRPEDTMLLSQDPIKWLDQQFDILYKYVKEGQELSSPVIQNLEQVISEATRYVQHNNPDSLDIFQTNFIVRLNLMTMRTTIGYRSVEQVKSAALRLTAHGLMYGFSMEKGEAGAMFNRLNELLDDQRLKSPRYHITPEMANELQERVIQEQLGLAQIGLGKFGDLRPEAFEGKSPEEREQELERVRADITRAVRISYDLFVDSQRQAIIVARGKKLTDTEAYFSDPSAGPLNVYNLEDLLTEKFDIINAHEYEALDETKLDLADEYVRRQREKNPGFDLSHQERIDLGTRLFRDLFAVPDFFSSGWRVKGILDAMTERMKAYYGEEEGKERAREMGLFLRLKFPQTGESRKEVWERIADFRPEEVVRLFRERSKGVLNLESRYQDLFKSAVFARNGIKNYDDFKDKYGTVLREIREGGFGEFRQINIGAGLSDLEAEMVNRFIGGEAAAADVVEMFKLMTTFSKGSISDLLSNNKFEDIYTRTINVDDTLLQYLERQDLEFETQDGQKIRVGGFTPLSQQWAADQGGDALVRNWNDTENAVQGAGHLIHFIKAEDAKEKLDSAIKFAEAASQYNGQSGRAKIVRFTYGTFLNISKKDYFWDIVGLEKLPLRLPMSRIERIFGPSAKPLGRDELRHEIDEISTKLVASLSKEAREGILNDDEEAERVRRGISIDQFRKERYKKEMNKAEAMLKDLESLAEVTTGDTLKRRALSVLLLLILLAIGETGRTVQGAAKEAA